MSKQKKKGNSGSKKNFLKLFIQGKSPIIWVVSLLLGGGIFIGVNNNSINSNSTINIDGDGNIVGEGLVRGPKQNPPFYVEPKSTLKNHQPTIPNINAEIKNWENNSLVEREEDILFILDSEIQSGKQFRFAIMATSKESCPYYYTKPIGPGARGGRIKALFGLENGSYGEEFKIIPVLMDRDALEDNQCSEDQDYQELLGVAIGEEISVIRSPQLATAPSQN